MRLQIVHRIELSYDQPVVHSLQRLRLVPRSGPTQTVRSWTLSVEGATEELHFTDHFGNDTRLISIEGEPRLVAIEAAGEVETFNKAGVTGAHRGFVPLWLFLRQTALTVPDDDLRALADSAGKGTDLARLHELMAAIHDRDAPAPTMSQMQSSGLAADQVQETGEADGPTGAARDPAHLFIAAARLLGFPSRYVSGYVTEGDAPGEAAAHGWAEAHVGGLGWVGFDPENGISPDDRHVRVAIGRDRDDTAPVSGIRLGQTEERLAIAVTVEQ